ncbi:hypothetical protein R7892_10130 [Ligilactobacillus murinus]|uniref:lipase family protein n=1 Tax=Ligilactobacillus murinus TaxID=1622 RepID=UPI00296AFE22|nr:hypothetical protein [Ligilactobacillus murinus]WOY89023.1 hypothetical protein R7892_10130 [Ligilactobacillus murinus]
MIPDLNEFNQLSNKVYDIDPLKGSNGRENKNLDGTNYTVLDISRNGTYGDKKQYGVPNHMQAMTVAPVKDGMVDYSQLTIAYAGTNPDDKVDLVTDVIDVADVDGTLSQTKNLVELFEPPVSQFDTALGYANYIQKRYPKAKIAVTGHSLGGSLALTVGAKKQLKTVTFNAPVPKDKLSKKDKQYILDNPTKITSYLNADDFIGNYNNSYTLFGGLFKGDFQYYYKNGTGMGDIDLEKTLRSLSQGKLVLKNGQTIPISKEKLEKLINENHNVANWFDEKGQLRYSHHKVTVSKTQNTFESKVAEADTNLVARLAKIRGLRKKYGHKYSVKGGKIKLDAALAYTLKTAIKDHGQAGIEVLEQTQKQIEAKLEANWNETLQMARQIGTDLTEEEILEVLHYAGADKESLYTKPVEKLNEQLRPLKQLKKDLADFDKAFDKSIKKRIADDQELAGEFGL